MSKPFYRVKKRTLLAIAGCVWFIAVFYTGLGCALAGVLSGYFLYDTTPQQMPNNKKAGQPQLPRFFIMW